MILVFDDFLTKTYADNIEHDVKNSIAYGYNEYTVAQGVHYDGPIFIDDKTYDVGQMSCPIVLFESQFPFSWWHERTKVLVYTLMDKVPEIKFNGLTRLKVNLLHQQKSAPVGHYNTAHQDTDIHTYSAVYYCNDSDGDTVLFNQFYNGTIPDKLTEYTRISPKKNRLVLFESNRFHASSYPINSKARFVLNFVFDAKDA
jgi:hypothetical protein